MLGIRFFHRFSGKPLLFLKKHNLCIIVQYTWNIAWNADSRSNRPIRREGTTLLGAFLYGFFPPKSNFPCLYLNFLTIIFFINLVQKVLYFSLKSTKIFCKTIKRLKVRNFESWKGAATPHRILNNLFRPRKNEVNKYYFSSRKITE